MIADALAAGLVIVGAAFSLVGAWALVGRPGFEQRLYGPGLTGTLGIACVGGAALLAVPGGGHGLLAVALLFVSAPVGSLLLLQAVRSRRG